MTDLFYACGSHVKTIDVKCPLPRITIAKGPYLTNVLKDSLNLDQLCWNEPPLTETDVN